MGRGCCEHRPALEFPKARGPVAPLAMLRGVLVADPVLSGEAAPLVESVRPVEGDREGGSRDQVPGRRFSVRAAGRVVDLRTKFAGSAVVAGARRGRVTGWSRASRRRFLFALTAINWHAFSGKLFVTLTYPADWPRQGPRAKAQLQAFKRWWERETGLPAMGAWKMEFQRRGAPHFHLLLVCPLSWAVELDVTRARVRAKWSAICGAEARVDVQVPFSDLGKYLTYAARGDGKRFKGGEADDGRLSQTEVPVDFVDVGRLWGIWGLRPEWSGEQLARGDYVELRRRLRRYARNVGARSPRGGRFVSSWFLLPVGRFAPDVLAQLARGLGRYVRTVPVAEAGRSVAWPGGGRSWSP